MAELCERAEALLKEKNINLSAEKRAILATYDDDTQVRWIVNPLVEWLLQSFTNQLINGRLQTPNTQSQPISDNKTPPAVVDKKPPQTNKPAPKPQPEPEPPGSDDDDIGLGLFD